MPSVDPAVFKIPPALVHATPRGLKAVDSCAIVWRCPPELAYIAILSTHHKSVLERLVVQVDASAFEGGGVFTHHTRKVMVIDWCLAPECERRTLLCHIDEAETFMAAITDGRNVTRQFGRAPWSKPDGH